MQKRLNLRVHHMACPTAVCCLHSVCIMHLLTDARQPPLPLPHPSIYPPCTPIALSETGQTYSLFLIVCHTIYKTVLTTIMMNHVIGVAAVLLVILIIFCIHLIILWIKQYCYPSGIMINSWCFANGQAKHRGSLCFNTDVAESKASYTCHKLIINSKVCTNFAYYVRWFGFLVRSSTIRFVFIKSVHQKHPYPNRRYNVIFFMNLKYIVLLKVLQCYINASRLLAPWEAVAFITLQR